MRRAALIVNPKAGRRGASAILNELLCVLSARGVDVQVVETTAAPDSARDLALKASTTCDLVIACGGDGTVHGVLQGVVNTPASLGVLPFGTANALARNLGLPIGPLAALDKLLGFTSRQIPLGVIESAGGTRYFTVMAGVGPDGRLVHEMKLAAKTQIGRQAYYAEAARLFVSRRFPSFRVEYRRTGSQTWQSQDVVAMMASRIPDLGGLFQGLTAKSRLHHPHLLVQLLAAPAHLSFPAWILFARSGLGSRNPWLTTLEVEELRCFPLVGRGDIYAQVDGEPLGTIPISIRIQTGALRLLMP